MANIRFFRNKVYKADAGENQHGGHHFQSIERVQPVIAMVIALLLGLDTLNALKVLASVLVFTGVGLVNFVPKKS